MFMLVENCTSTGYCSQKKHKIFQKKRHVKIPVIHTQFLHSSQANLENRQHIK